MKYELEPGDMINRKGQPAIGVLLERFVNKDGSVYWEYVLRSPNLKSWKPQIGRYTIEEDKLFRKLEEAKYVLHYGTLKNRRPRDVD